MMRDWNYAFAILNIIGAMLVAGLMIETTPSASISRARYDSQAMWGMIRRLFYLCMSGGMLGKALWVVEGWITPTRGDMVFWLMIVCPLGLFLIIRGLRLVDQDRWIGFQHRRDRTTERQERRESYTRHPER